MKNWFNWLLLVSLLATGGASCTAPAAAPIQPRLPARAPNPLQAQADQELENRGLYRTDAHPQVAPPNWAETLGSLYILARTRDGQVALVGSGAQLHTGEEIELHVTVGRPAYVYLIQISASDEATILYPVAGEPEKLLPNIDYRMPSNTNVYFKLDNNVGTERLAFIVTEQAFAAGDSGVRALVEELRASGRWATEADGGAPRKPSGAVPAPANARAASDTGSVPQHGTGGTRNFGRALDAQPDDTGVSRALFTFEHIP
ncbi:MAG TPA: DUF4384 domain-containing protein [Polyangiaceae bacterium]